MKNCLFQPGVDNLYAKNNEIDVIKVRAMCANNVKMPITNGNIFSSVISLSLRLYVYRRSTLGTTKKIPVMLSIKEFAQHVESYRGGGIYSYSILIFSPIDIFSNEPITN
jgi:hypothetical protein